MFPLFESIKIVKGKPQFLEWHQRRFESSQIFLFGESAYKSLENIIIVPDEFKEGLVKCRLEYNQTDYSLEFTNYIPRKTRTLKIVKGDDIDYSLKYTDRSLLERCFSMRESCDDVLILKNKRITDSSYANIVFSDGKHWHTPLFPLLEGTQRNRLIKNGIIEAVDIEITDLKKYETFRLINAMLDFEEQAEYGIENIII